MTSECEHEGGSRADIMHGIMLFTVMNKFQGRLMAGSMQLWTGGLRSHLANYSHSMLASCDTSHLACDASAVEGPASGLESSRCLGSGASTSPFNTPLPLISGICRATTAVNACPKGSYCMSMDASAPCVNKKLDLGVVSELTSEFSCVSLSRGCPWRASVMRSNIPMRFRV